MAYANNIREIRKIRGYIIKIFAVENNKQYIFLIYILWFG